MPIEWKEIVQLGSTAVVAIVAILSVIKLTTNHINHNTAAIDRLADEIKGLREDLKDILRDLLAIKK